MASTFSNFGLLKILMTCLEVVTDVPEARLVDILHSIRMFIKSETIDVHCSATGNNTAGLITPWRATFLSEAFHGCLQTLWDSVKLAPNTLLTIASTWLPTWPITQMHVSIQYAGFVAQRKLDKLDVTGELKVARNFVIVYEICFTAFFFNLLNQNFGPSKN
jgi:hypothetical protein